MYLSEPLSDDQVLMRYFRGNRFPQLLDSAPAFADWAFLEQPTTGIAHRVPQPSYGALWMSLPHTFTDTEEGMFPAINLDDEAYCRELARLLGLTEEEAERRKTNFIENNPSELRAGIRARTRLCGVSCWYQGSNESKAMWDEYGGDSTGVLVKTTVKQLEESLGWVSPQTGNRTSRPMFSTINYVDRDNFFTAEDGYYHLLGIKGEGYQHEREVRLIAKSPEFVRCMSSENGPTLEEVEQLASRPPNGFNLLTDIVRLITDIRVHPAASSSYLDEVRSLLVPKGVSAELVRHSEL